MHGAMRSRRQKDSEVAKRSRFQRRPETFVQRREARGETVDPVSRLERAGRLGRNLVHMAAAPESTVAQRDEAAPKNETGMPDRLKGGLEQLSGLDMSGVRVHRNSARPAQVGALAYTQGQEIHVGPGQESSLAHEGWHAVQQKQGRVRPTGRVAGLPLNDEVGLEREADVMGAKALQPTAAPGGPLHRTVAVSDQLKHRGASREAPSILRLPEGVATSPPLQRDAPDLDVEELHPMSVRSAEAEEDLLEVEEFFSEVQALNPDWKPEWKDDASASEWEWEDLYDQFVASATARSAHIKKNIETGHYNAFEKVKKANEINTFLLYKGKRWKTGLAERQLQSFELVWDNYDDRCRLEVAKYSKERQSGAEIDAPEWLNQTYKDKIERFETYYLLIGESTFDKDLERLYANMERSDVKLLWAQKQALSEVWTQRAIKCDFWKDSASKPSFVKRADEASGVAYEGGKHTYEIKGSAEDTMKAGRHSKKIWEDGEAGKEYRSKDKYEGFKESKESEKKFVDRLTDLKEAGDIESGAGFFIQAAKGLVGVISKHPALEGLALFKKFQSVLDDHSMMTTFAKAKEAPEPKTKAAAEYGFAKVRRKFIGTVREFISSLVSLTEAIILVLGGPAAVLVATGLRIVRLLFESAITIWGKVKGIYKYFAKTRGEGRKENARILVQEASVGDEAALDLILDSEAYKKKYTAWGQVKKGKFLKGAVESAKSVGPESDFLSDYSEAVKGIDDPKKPKEERRKALQEGLKEGKVRGKIEKGLAFVMKSQ